MGSIGTQGLTETITQTSQRGIIDFNSFSIGKSGTVKINNGTGATLDHVTGGSLSQIMGTLSATGSVYLVNPQGVVVGKSGVVTTGGSAESRFTLGNPSDRRTCMGTNASTLSAMRYRARSPTARRRPTAVAPRRAHHAGVAHIRAVADSRIYNGTTSSRGAPTSTACTATRRTASRRPSVEGRAGHERRAPCGECAVGPVSDGNGGEDYSISFVTAAGRSAGGADVSARGGQPDL